MSVIEVDITVPHGNRIEFNNDTEIRTYRYRWVIIALYGLYAGANLFQINQFTIIDNVTEKYYGTTAFFVYMSQLIFMITLIVFIVPSVYIIEKYNLRVVGIICSGLTFLGSLVKLLGIEPGPTNFYIIILGQGICAIGQVFMIMLPAKVVAVWCSAEEQNRACGLTLWGGEIGMLVGAVCPIFFVKDKESLDDTRVGISRMLISNAILCGIVFGAVFLFFRKKPKLPPSPQQLGLVDVEIKYGDAFSELRGNKNFILINCIFGISCGLWSVFGIIENKIYLNYFEDSLADLATITLVTTISGGMIGNVLFGYILDKTLKYKFITLFILSCTALSYAVMGFCLEMKWYTASFISIIVYGFFCSSQVNISFQYIAEVTYPISEAITLAVLQVTISAVTVIYVLLFTILLDAKLFRVVHVVTFLTFVAITIAAQFLSSNLKRMLVEKKR